MSEKESIRTESENDVKKAVKKLIGNKFDQADIIECVVEAMFIGMVESVPCNERLEYLLKNKYLLREFIKYIDIDYILSETIETQNGVYTPEMLDYVLNLQINIKREEKFFII